MITTLTELDEHWSGTNVDKSSLKLLCRKYGPKLMLDWIHRGLTIQKEITVEWHKKKLQELGEQILTPEAIPAEGEQNLAEDYGDYFTE